MTVPTVEQASELFEVFKRGANGPLWGHEFINKSELVDIKEVEGKTVVTFVVHTEERMQNSHQIVHGGFSATLIDYLTTYAFVGDKRYWLNDLDTGDRIHMMLADFGVTRNLSLQYLKAIPINSDLYVECRLDSNTRRYTYTTCRLHDGKGTTYVLAGHDKAKLPLPSKL